MAGLSPLIWCCALGLFFLCVAQVPAQDTLRIGIYSVAPLAFLDEQKKAQGLFVDVLEYVAQKNNWKLQYVPGTFQENLDWLEQGSIDVVMCVASSEKRREKYDFTQQQIYMEWGMVFKQKGANLETILDLKGKRIGVLKGDIFTTEFQNLLQQFDIKAELVEKNEYFEILEALGAKELDAGFNANYSGYDVESRYAVERTTILFAPTKIQYAVKKGRNRDLLATMDYEVAKLVADKSSVYYSSYRKWLGLGGQPQVMPTWVFYALVALFVLMGSLFVTALVFRQQVKRRTAALRESEAQNRALIHAIPDLIFTNNRDGRFLAVQAPDPQMLFLPQENFLQRKIEDVLPDSISHLFLAAYQEALDHGVVQELNYTSLLVDEERHFEARIAPCTKDTVITFVRDITARKKIENSLRESEENLKMAQAVAHVGNWTLDLQKNQDVWSDEMYRIFGIDPNTVIGRPGDRILEIVHPDDRERLKAYYAQDYSQRGPIEYRIFSSNGSLRYVSVVLGLVQRDKDGKPAHLHGICQDITDRKNEELKRQNLEAQLQQSQKMESLGLLAGGVAHDMNNVLAAIAAICAIQKNNGPGSPFVTIQKAVNRGRSMVSGLLNFTRKNLAEIKPLDWNTVIQDQLVFLRHTTLSQVTLKTELEPQLSLIEGDPNALGHALMNLCVNSVDALHEQEAPRILTLSTRTENGQVVVEIQDNGIGMPPEVQQRALDPFFTTKPQGKGTGLGLSQVYSIVMAHNGQMSIESTVGIGTTIRMAFPAVARSTLQQDIPGKRTRLVTGEQIHTLLVDDDEMVRESFIPLLVALGCQVTSAETGEAGLKILEKGIRIDLVILDMNMPGMGGPKTLKEIRRLYPELSVLVTTGLADQGVIDLVASTPNTELMEKPFDLLVLKNFLLGVETTR